MENATIVYIASAIIGILGIIALAQKGKKAMGMPKMVVGLVLIVFAVGLIAMQQGYLASYGLSPLSAGAVSGVTTTTSGGTVISSYQPTATFVAKDKFSTTEVVGTSYYKRGTGSASTTAISNTNPGESLAYWVDNATYWVQPAVTTAGASVTAVRADAFANGTATVTLYDLVNRQSLSTSGTYNTSMGASKQANIEVTYQGTAKKSAMPFGGVLIVESNASISSVTCTGDDILSSNPFHVTYTASSTQNTYRMFPIASTIDDGSGSVKKITCQFNNGATAVGAGTQYYFKFIPANYYVSQTGEILLDTEKFANADTTRVGSTINYPSVSAYWGA